MIITEINIPDINENPFVISPIVLNNRTYYFEYRWNVRDNSAYLSIYYLSNNSKIYLLRNSKLIVGNIISKHINDLENWDGLLSLWNYDELTMENYSQANLSTDYFLKFVI
jgi:hypothetical protein